MNAKFGPEGKTQQVTRDLEMICRDSELNTSFKNYEHSFVYETGFGNAQMGVDQVGQPLTITTKNENNSSAAYTRPVWPPAGFNIILSARRPGGLRSVWPRPGTYSMSNGRLTRTCAEPPNQSNQMSSTP